MDDLAARIEALTDEECLSLTGPWRITGATAVAGTFSLALTNGEVVYPFDEGGLSEALAKANRRNAAHVRERLRELMGR